MSTTAKQPSCTGRISIGRLQRSILKEDMPVSLVKRDGSIIKMHIKERHTFEGIERKRVEEVKPVDICAIVGFETRDTAGDIKEQLDLASIAIDEPTMNMLFTINDSPF
jgi:GTP-binding protein